MRRSARLQIGLTVAPVRERGLKFEGMVEVNSRYTGRSRKGAWIEIVDLHNCELYVRGRSRKGAWIEINSKPFC